ncbi:MAG: alpha/beta hydrolase [Deltaproteobacteria bacterium]|nr:alpha/beta hydrolase [Deltaproteobacteria bacterium]
MRSVLAFTIIFKRMIKQAIVIWIILCLSACTNLVFCPDQFRYTCPDKFGLDHEDIFLATADGNQLHGWLLKSSSEKKGTVFFLHGNAQNISAHIHSVYWLPENGYDVFMIDYRGYGQSTGSPSVRGVIDDITTGFTWLTKNVMDQKTPIFLLGQSLGASLGICFAGSNLEAKNQLSGVILDSGFSNFRTIAREKLSQFWLTWPFQYPLSMLLTDKYNPEDFIQHISPVPVLIMHSDEDKVIPSSHGKRLFKLAGTPKCYIQTGDGHINTFRYNAYRNEVLKFMSRFSFKSFSAWKPVPSCYQNSSSFSNISDLQTGSVSC